MTTRKKKAVKKVPAAKAAPSKSQLREAKSDLSEARKRAMACRKAVGVAQKECIDGHPDAVRSSAKYREAVSAHIKAIRQHSAAAARVTKLM